MRGDPERSDNIRRHPPAAAPPVGMASLKCTSASCIDLTDPDMPQKTLQWLLSHHSVALSTIAAYILIKLLARLVWRLTYGTKHSSTTDYASRLWDPVCLVHNCVSVVVGLYSLAVWESSDSAGT